MIAGTSKIDITPSGPVWMDGMIRDRKSEGIHDPIFARALVISPDYRMEHACAFVSVEVCGIRGDDAGEARRSASMATGIPVTNIIIAATHTHSGPATIGFFNPQEHEYLALLLGKIVSAIVKAVEAARPVLFGCVSGREDTISHYRRLLARDGHVVMNWEPYPPEKIAGPLGEIDPEVGTLQFVETADPGRYVGILYNHAGHPNVMSGDNYLISGDYPGLASRLLEEEYGCVALFMNGAEGTMDIDGLRDRDWEGVGRTGKALAEAVSETVRRTAVKSEPVISSGHTRYTLSARKITANELKVVA